MRGEGSNPEGSSLLDRASEVFFAVRELDPAAQDEMIARMCGADGELAALVRLLLRGDKAPLPVESLADDIRAAQATRSLAGEGHVPGSKRAAPPTSIGNYKVLERLGEGGFGIVYLAEQERPVRRRVALKIIKLGMDTRQVVARFEAERQALAMMDHPGIAKVFDAGATETGRPYFVMELVRGLPITEYCDQKTLSIRERLELLAQVCDALQHAHQKGVIHRDIKPSNVLVTEAGDRATPKVIDFGVAKATTARLTEKTVYTEFRQMIGTPEYMSPEQAGLSADDVDTRTDVYSVGVLLYELLTGATPFDSHRLRSAAYGEIQRIIREEDPPRPSTKIATKRETLASVAQQRSIQPLKLTRTIRGDLDWIVMKAMEKDRARRYESAASLGSDIRRYLSGEAVLAAPPGRAYVARKFVRRHRGAVIAAGLVLGALVAGLLGTSIGFVNAETQRKAAVSERKRADTKAEEALAAEAAARRHAYSASMLSAWQAMALNQPSVVRKYLDATPPSLRGWEWRVLSSRLDTSVRSLACPMLGWSAGEDHFAYGLTPHPDGRSFFTLRGYQPVAVQRWDAATGRLIGEYSRPTDRPPDQYAAARYALSGDGTRLSIFCGTTGSPRPCAAGVWDLSTNVQLGGGDVAGIQLGEGILGAAADCSLVASSSDVGREIVLQAGLGGRVLARRSTSDVTVQCVFSPDGALLAASNERGLIRLMDTGTLAQVAELRGHKNLAYSMVFSPDGRTFGSASMDNTARIWNLAARPPTSIELTHPCTVECISLSSDGSIAATIGSDRAIRVWNVRTGERLGLCSTDRLVPGAVMVMPDGRSVAGRERDGTVRFWDINADSTVNLGGHKGYINAALPADGGNIIVSAAWDGWRGERGCVRFWDGRTGDEIAGFGSPGEVAYALAVSPDGRRAAAILTRAVGPWTPPGQQGSSRLLEVDFHDLTVAVVAQFETTPKSANRFSIAFDSSGEHLAVGRGGALEVRSAVDGRVLRHRSEGLEQFSVGCVAWSPDGQTIACFPTASVGRQIIGVEQSLLVDAGTLATKQVFTAPAPFNLRFSFDSSNVFAGSRDGMVRTFDVATGAMLRQFQAHDRLVSDIAPSPDGTRLATVGGDEGDIVIWDTTTPPPYQRVARFHEDGFVSGAVWDAAGGRLVGACDKTIRIWDDTPLRDRVAWRDARARAIAKLGPRIDAMFDELHAASAVAARLKDDHALDAAEQRAGAQLILRRVVRAASEAAPPAP